MARTREHKALYGILGIGAVATFLGHGMWAIGGKESFVGLLTNSLKNMLGIDMSAATGETIVRTIGWIDLSVATVMALFVIGALLERGSLYRAAYSMGAMVVFGWGVLWGFATAFSRITAAETWYPAFWDWIERAPNFMLPAALIYVIVRHRRLDVPTHAPFETEYTTH